MNPCFYLPQQTKFLKYLGYVSNDEHLSNFNTVWLPSTVQGKFSGNIC